MEFGVKSFSSLLLGGFLPHTPPQELCLDTKVREAALHFARSRNAHLKTIFCLMRSQAPLR